MLGIIAIILVIMGAFSISGDRWYVGAVEVVLGVICAVAAKFLGEDD